MEKWQLQKAKNKLSEVVNLAIIQGPQTITRRGADAVVILSFKDYRKLIKPKESLVDFFQKSPFAGVKLDTERNKDLAREINL